MMPEDLSAPAKDPAEHLYTHWSLGYYAPRLLFAAVSLGIPELLAKSPLTPESIAQATGTKSPLLTKVCNGLAALGVIYRSEDGRFGLTLLGMGLLPGTATASRHLVTLHGGVFQDSWAGLLNALKKGTVPFQEVHGKNYYDYLQTSRSETETLIQGMRETSQKLAASLIRQGRFERFNTLADLGGNQGDVLALVLVAFPNLKGILCDHAAILEEAPDILEAAGVHDRVDIVVADVRTALPFKADACLLCRILYNWPEDEAVNILKQATACLPTGGTLLIVDTLMPPNPSVTDVFQDLFLAVNFGGEARTNESFQSMLMEAGLELVRCEKLDDFYSLLEARKSRLNA